MTTPAASSAATPRPGTRQPKNFRLSPTARKSAVVVHIVSSVSWLGLMLCLLTLGATGLLTDSAETLRSAYRMMPVLGDALVFPLSLLSLLTGLLLALGTPGACSGTAGLPSSSGSPWPPPPPRSSNSPPGCTKRPTWWTSTPPAPSRTCTSDSPATTW